MQVLEPGHVYKLDVLDGTEPVILTFVNREAGMEHSGTQTQEVLRAMIDATEVLIDRTNHCDGCLPWPGNERIIKAMSEAQRQFRLALIYHEQRVLERLHEKGQMKAEEVPVGADGHYQFNRDPRP